MYIKTKCCFLKEDIDPKVLKKYGFNTSNKGKSYSKDIEGDKLGFIMWYKDTRRFVYKYPKRTSYKFLRKYLVRLIQDGLVEVKPMYEWLAIVGRWQDYSLEKKALIEAKLEEKNNKLWKKD